MSPDETDELYLRLHGAREKLCGAQMLASPEPSRALGEAVARIDRVGAALCGEQWSADDRDDLLPPSDELVSTIANAIGWAMEDPPEGTGVVVIGADSLARYHAAAVRALHAMNGETP